MKRPLKLSPKGPFCIILCDRLAQMQRSPRRKYIAEAVIRGD
jgi:hypothetical protein